MAKVIGNKSPAWRQSGSQGIGSQGIPTNTGWVACAGQAGETLVVGLAGIKVSDINQGIFFQASAAAGVEFTLGPYNMANSNADGVSESTLWGSAITLTPGVITPCEVLFTACKITFTETGFVYIAVS